MKTKTICAMMFAIAVSASAYAQALQIATPVAGDVGYVTMTAVAVSPTGSATASDSVHILPAKLELVSPQGGEAWQEGTTQAMKWHFAQTIFGYYSAVLLNDLVPGEYRMGQTISKKEMQANVFISPALVAVFLESKGDQAESAVRAAFRIEIRALMDQKAGSDNEGQLVQTASSRSGRITILASSPSSPLFVGVNGDNVISAGTPVTLAFLTTGAIGAAVSWLDVGVSKGDFEGVDSFAPEKSVASHTFRTPGRYDVIFEARDSKGSPHFFSTSVRVEPAASSETRSVINIVSAKDPITGKLSLGFRLPQDLEDEGAGLRDGRTLYRREKNGLIINRFLLEFDLLSYGKIGRIPADSK